MFRGEIKRTAVLLDAGFCICSSQLLQNFQEFMHGVGSWLGQDHSIYRGSLALPREMSWLWLCSLLHCKVDRAS